MLSWHHWLSDVQYRLLSHWNILLRMHKHAADVRCWSVRVRGANDIQCDSMCQLCCGNLVISWVIVLLTLQRRNVDIDGNINNVH